MDEIVAADYPMTGREVTRDEAIAPSTATLIRLRSRSEIPEGQPITLYTIGDVYRSLPRRPCRFDRRGSGHSS